MEFALPVVQHLNRCGLSLLSPAVALSIGYYIKGKKNSPKLFNAHVSMFLYYFIKQKSLVCVALSPRLSREVMIYYNEQV